MKDTNKREVWVSVGITINLGNYESARVDAGIKLPVEDDDKIKDVYKEAWGKALKEVEEQAVEVKAQLK